MRRMAWLLAQGFPIGIRSYSRMHPRCRFPRPRDCFHPEFASTVGKHRFFRPKDPESVVRIGRCCRSYGTRRRTGNCRTGTPRPHPRTRCSTRAACQERSTTNRSSRGLVPPVSVAQSPMQYCGWVYQGFCGMVNAFRSLRRRPAARVHAMPRCKACLAMGLDGRIVAPKTNQTGTHRLV